MSTDNTETKESLEAGIDEDASAQISRGPLKAHKGPSPKEIQKERVAEAQASYKANAVPTGKPQATRTVKVKLPIGLHESLKEIAGEAKPPVAVWQVVLHFMNLGIQTHTNAMLAAQINAQEVEEKALEKIAEEEIAGSKGIDEAYPGEEDAEHH